MFVEAIVRLNSSPKTLLSMILFVIFLSASQASTVPETALMENLSEDSKVLLQGVVVTSVADAH